MYPLFVPCSIAPSFPGDMNTSGWLQVSADSGAVVSRTPNKIALVGPPDILVKNQEQNTTESIPERGAVPGYATYRWDERIVRKVIRKAQTTLILSVQHSDVTSHLQASWQKALSVSVPLEPLY
jgi:hypothetical protein